MQISPTKSQNVRLLRHFRALSFAFLSTHREKEKVQTSNAHYLESIGRKLVYGFAQKLEKNRLFCLARGTEGVVQ